MPLDDNKRRVMIVDDDVPLLNTLVEMVSTEYEAIGAVNGLDALEKIDRYEPDLVILDVAMPCVNGIDTCRAIRKHVRFNEVPVVFLSGRDETEYVDQAQGLNAIRFLRKPIAPNVLLQCCREAFNETKSPTPEGKRYSLADLESIDSYQDAERVPGADSATIAMEPDQPVESTGEKPDEPYGGSTPARIMVIDDDVDVISYIVAVLRDYFEVFGVDDPVSAIYKIIRYQPDLIVLDIAMPRMSGYQLSQLLRLNRNLRAIKILFASSKDRPEEIEYAKKLGVCDYLVKPFSAEDLLRAVTAIVDAPDFIVREKAMSFDDIRRAESVDAAPSQLI